MACLRNQWVDGFVMMCAAKVLDTPYLYLIYATMIGLFSYNNAV
jgi:hypothetical protein